MHFGKYTWKLGILKLGVASYKYYILCVVFLWAFVCTTRGRRPSYGIFLWERHPITFVYERTYSRRANIQCLVHQQTKIAELGIYKALPLELEFWVSFYLFLFLFYLLLFVKRKWSKLNLVCHNFFWHCHVQKQICYDYFNKLWKKKKTSTRCREDFICWVDRVY